MIKMISLIKFFVLELMKIVNGSEVNFENRINSILLEVIKSFLKAVRGHSS
jgi:hypothetical protein